MINLDAEFSHVLNGAEKCIVAGFKYLDLSACARLVEWTDKTVLFTKFFYCHCCLRPDHSVDSTDYTQRQRHLRLCSVATQFMCSWIFNNHVIANFPQTVSLKEFLQEGRESLQCGRCSAC